jgi:hypothetical protein
MARSRFPYGRCLRFVGALLLGAMSVALVGASSSCEPPNSPSLWGFNEGLGVGATDADLRTAYAGGFRWVRITVSWDSIQPSADAPPDSWNWASLTEQISPAYSAGLSILLTFYDVPTWASVGSTTGGGCNGDGARPTSTPPNSPDHFLAFISEVAKRYGPFVRGWELWNEPNRCNFFNGSPQQYRDMILVPGVQGIRASGYPATILAPGIAGGVGPSGLKSELDKYLTYVDVSSGNRYLAAPIDIYSFHAYDSVSTVRAMLDTADTYTRCTADASKCLVTYWLTEFGYDPNTQRCWVCSWGSPYPESAANAAIDVFSYCARANSLCWKAFYYDLVDSNSPPTPNCDCDVALYNSDHTPRTRFSTISQYLLNHP